MTPRAVAFALAAIAALVTASGTAGAQSQSSPQMIGSFTLLDLETARITAVITMPGDFARSMRNAADSDGDGTVSPGERDAFEGFFVGEAGEETDVTLDGWNYVTEARSDTSSEGLEGPVDQAGPVIVTIDGRSRLNGTAATGVDHVLQGALVPDESAGGGPGGMTFQSSVTFRVPPDHRITAVDGADQVDPCTARTPDAEANATIRFTAAPGDCPAIVTATDQPDGGDETPGPGTALVLAIAVALAALTRGPRGRPTSTNP